MYTRIVSQIGGRFNTRWGATGNKESSAKNHLVNISKTSALVYDPRVTVSKQILRSQRPVAVPAGSDIVRCLHWRTYKIPAVAAAPRVQHTTNKRFFFFFFFFNFFFLFFSFLKWPMIMLINNSSLLFMSQICKIASNYALSHEPSDSVKGTAFINLVSFSPEWSIFPSLDKTKQPPQIDHEVIKTTTCASTFMLWCKIWWRSRRNNIPCDWTRGSAQCDTALWVVQQKTVVFVADAVSTTLVAFSPSPKTLREGRHTKLLDSRVWIHGRGDPGFVQQWDIRQQLNSLNRYPGVHVDQATAARTSNRGLLVTPLRTDPTKAACNSYVIGTWWQRQSQAYRILSNARILSHLFIFGQGHDWKIVTSLFFRQNYYFLLIIKPLLSTETT